MFIKRLSKDTYLGRGDICNLVSECRRDVVESCDIVLKAIVFEVRTLFKRLVDLLNVVKVVFEAATLCVIKIIMLK